MENPYRLLALALGAAAWLAAPVRGSAAETAVFQVESAKAATEPIAVASQRVSNDATTRREVAALLQRWVDLRNDGRWDELGTLLADDPRFAWVEFGRVTMGSHAAALTELAKARGRPAQTFTEFSDTVVEPLTSELALLRAKFHISAAGSATAQGIDRVGVLTATLMFREGRWQFLQVNFSQTR